MNFIAKTGSIIMEKQPRDSKGRFLSWDGTRNRKYSIAQIKDAFLHGIEYGARKGMTAQKMLEIYLSNEKLD